MKLPYKGRRLTIDDAIPSSGHRKQALRKGWRRFEYIVLMVIVEWLALLRFGELGGLIVVAAAILLACILYAFMDV